MDKWKGGIMRNDMLYCDNVKNEKWTLMKNDEEMMSCLEVWKLLKFATFWTLSTRNSPHCFWPNTGLGALQEALRGHRRHSSLVERECEQNNESSSRSVFSVLQTHNQATTGWEWDVGRLVQCKLCPKPTDCCTYYVSGMVGAGIDGSLENGAI